MINVVRNLKKRGGEDHLLFFHDHIPCAPGNKRPEVAISANPLNNKAWLGLL